MQQTVKNWLSQGIVDIFLGYKRCHGHALPHCFCMEKLEEVDELVESPARYSLEKIATHIAAQKPDLAHSSARPPPGRRGGSHRRRCSR